MLAGRSENTGSLLQRALRTMTTTPTRGDWRPIETVPQGEHVLLYWPEGERGNGGMECATVYHGDPMSFWTHGGPNSGLDWEPRNDEKPTHWMPLPDPPARPASTP